MGIQAVRGGHNFQCPGASAILDETTEDRKVCASVISNFKSAGETVVDCTPGRCSEDVDLDYGTNKANNSKANTYVPIHFNKAYDKYIGRIGCEVWLNPNNASSVAKGTRVCNNLAALGFKNRGLKDGVNVEHLHDIKQSNMDAVLVEVCFVEATEDVVLYKKLGPGAIGNAIVEGILGRNIAGNATVVSTPSRGIKVGEVPATRVNNSIAQLQTELNKQGFGPIAVDGFYGVKTLGACPTIKYGANGKITEWLQKRLTLKLQDGIFGTGTKTAVMNYQRAVKLYADGIVGPKTWDALLK